MPSFEQKKAALKKVHNHPNWHEKVDAMPKNQVAAVYQRMLDQKKIK